MTDQQAYTPGPWFQSHRKMRNGNYSTEVYDKDGETICTLSWFPVPTERTIETSREANARLISAAPDMLAALKSLCEADRDDLNDSTSAVWQEAVAAIRSAEGASMREVSGEING